MTTPDGEENDVYEVNGQISDRLREQLPADDPAWTPKRIPDNEIFIDPATAARAEVTPLGDQDRVTEEDM